MENPFVFGAALERGQLIDREIEVAEVTRAMLERQKLFLVGPRRFGKTSILNVAEQAAQGEGAVVLRHDAEAYPTADALVAAIVSSAASKLAGIMERAGDHVVRFFRALRPELTYDGLTQRWSAGIGLGDTRHADPMPLLIDALDGVSQMAESVRRPVAVVIDEFQRLIQTGGETLERQLRATVQRHTKVAYVFAGSKTTLLDDMTLNPARPFYRLGARLFLGPVPREAFIAAIRSGFTNARYSADDAAITRILDLAEDVPYNVQALSHTAWEAVRGRDRGAAQLTGDVVDQALDRLVQQDGPFYAKLWNLCTPTQQRALLAVITSGGRELYRSRLLQSLRITPSGMTKALSGLEARDIIRREDQLNEVRWRLEDPFFAAWLAHSGALASQGLSGS